MVDQAVLRDAVAAVKLENPTMGVKKLVALVKKQSAELASVGAKEVRKVLAELEEAKASPPAEISAEPAPEPSSEEAAAPAAAAASVGSEAEEAPAGPAPTEPPPATAAAAAAASAKLPPRPRSALKPSSTAGRPPKAWRGTEGAKAPLVPPTRAPPSLSIATMGFDGAAVRRV